MNKVRLAMKCVRRDSGRTDILAIALIAVILVGALIFFLLRIIGHSEEHVDKVRKTKIKYNESLRWRSDSKRSESRIRADFAQSSGRKHADYGDLDLNEKSVKLIGKMTRLEELKLSRSTIQDDWLVYLTKLPLKTLSLQGTLVTDKAVPYILQMKKLNSLSIGDTELTDKGLKELSSSKSITHLKINLGRRITNDGIKYIGEMTQLEQLELPSSKHLSGACLVYLKDLRKLNFLNLDSMKIRSEDLVFLSSLKKLSILELSNSGLTDKDAAEVANVASLEILSLRGSDITDKGLLSLLNLKRLKRLNIKDCPGVKESAVQKFKAAVPGIKIKYSPMSTISEKLSREDVKMELDFLKLEAANELEKSDKNSK